MTLTFLFGSCVTVRLQSPEIARAAAGIARASSLWHPLLTFGCVYVVIAYTGLTQPGVPHVRSELSARIAMRYSVVDLTGQTSAIGSQ
jgi:hypothetical protein